MVAHKQKTIQNLLRGLGLAVLVSATIGCANTQKTSMHNDDHDHDNDQVLADADRCPFTEAGVEVNSQGCEADSDRDGVADRYDQCLGTAPADAVNSNGCAWRTTDADLDGVLNTHDRCPGTPSGAPVNLSGCSAQVATPAPAPRPILVPIIAENPEPMQVIVLEGVHFDLDSARLTINARAILDRVAADLKRVSSERTVELAGHTDNRGSSEYNLRLSHRRAASVLNYLRDRGVSSERMVSRGYGESRPRIEEENEAAWAANRRVELRFLN